MRKDKESLAVPTHRYSMLKRRIITAFILITLVIPGVIFLPTQILALPLIMIACIAAWEWCICAGIRHWVHRVLYVAVMLLVSIICLYVLDNHWLFLVVLGGLLWWNIAVLLVIFYQRNKWCIYSSSTIFKALIGILLLIPCCLSLMFIHSSASGKELLLYLLFSIWLADSSAYFAGQIFAKKTLANKISPAKSWEGVYAALAAVFCLGCGYVIFKDMQRVKAFLFVLLTLVMVIFSIVGDLLESMFKRMANLKDSGDILPGHGGVLDRIDSLTAAAPVFCVGLWLMDMVP